MNPPDAFNLTKRYGRAQLKLNLMKTKFLLADRFTQSVASFKIYIICSILFRRKLKE